MNSKFLNICKFFLGFIFLNVIVLLFFHKQLIQYWWCWVFFPCFDPTWTLFIMGMLSILLIILFIWLFKKKGFNFQFLESKKFFYVVLVIGTIALLLWQNYMIYHILYIPIWDIGFTVCNSWWIFPFDLTTAYITGHSIDHISMYPNLCMLRSIFIIISQILNMFNIDSTLSFIFFNDCFHFGFVYFRTFQILVSLMDVISIVLIMFICRKLFNNKIAIVSFILGIMFIGTNLNTIVPYSDAIGLFFTTCSLFSYVCIRNKYIKWPLIFCLCIAGYFIKPTIIFVCVSICCVELVRSLKKNQIHKMLHLKEFLLNDIKCITLIILSCVVVFNFCNFIINRYNIIDEDKSFGPSHYLMLGLNKGFIIYFDEAISFSAKDREERYNLNIAIWKQRLKDFGIVGYAEFIQKKLLYTYERGTLNIHNPFKLEQYEIIESKILECFYSLHKSEYAHNIPDWELLSSSPYSMFAQLQWICMLFFCMIACIKSKKKQIYVIVLTILLLTIFLLIFESSSRYLFLYSSFYLILSIEGFTIFYSFIMKYIEKISCYIVKLIQNKLK